MLITSNFSFSHNVFYLFGELPAILIKFKIGLQALSVWKGLKFIVWERVNPFQMLPTESAIGFGLAKGDLVKLDKPYDEYADSDVYSGTAIKNNKHGGIPRDVLYILATTDEPPANVMVILP